MHSFPGSRIATVFGAISVLSIACFAASIFPPLWTYPLCATYWAQTPTNFDVLRREWLVNDADMPLFSFALPVDAAPALQSLGGGVHAKVYVDVCAFYSFVASLLLLGFAATLCTPVRRCFHRRVISPSACACRSRLHPWLASLAGDGVASFSLGEVLLIALTLGLFFWWAWWWSTGFSYIRDAESFQQDPHYVTQKAARVFGHLSNLALSLVLFPVARNSVWEAAFGVPFDRALYYHRAMGRVAWLFTTLHMLTWMGKWAIEGTLLHNVVTTNDLLVWATEPWVTRREGETDLSFPGVPTVTAQVIAGVATTLRFRLWNSAGSS